MTDLNEQIHDNLVQLIHDNLVRAKETYRAEAHRLAGELAYLKILADNAVREFPVASGLYVDTDGQAGYGSLKAMRLYLGMPPERNRTLK